MPGVPCSHERRPEDRRFRRRSVFPDDRHRGHAGAGAAPRLGRALRDGARGRAVPLRRLEEQAVLRRYAHRDRVQGSEHLGPGEEQARGLRRQARHDPRQPRDLLARGPLHRRAEVGVPHARGTLDRPRRRGGREDRRDRQEVPVWRARRRDRRRRRRAAAARADGDGHRRRPLRGHGRHRAPGREVRRRRLEGALHAVPLRRLEEQALLRRLALGREVPRPRLIYLAEKGRTIMRSTIPALAAAVAIAACATPSLDVDYDYDTGADYAALKTFAWMPATGNAAGDELLVKRIRGAVDSQLQKKGRTAASGSPDFLIAMQLSGKTAYGGSTGVGVSVG